MNQLEYFNTIRTFIFDVDGVLTNSQLLITENGELLRSMNTRDGFAMSEAIRAGYNIAIITGGTSTGVTERLKNLGVVHIYTGYTGTKRKINAYEELLSILKVKEEEVLYMGDDVPDLEIMGRVGLPACPADAAPEVRKISRYISAIDGGRGCVRDVIERVLRLNGDWS